MQLHRASLGGDVRRVVRVVGDQLLARMRKTAEDLFVEGEPEALHDFRVATRRLRSWLRAFTPELDDTLGAKQHRRLDRISDSTRESRDLEVHIAWVEQFARARRKRNRTGVDWLVARLGARKARADLELRRVIDAELERTEAAIRKALGHYTVQLNEPNEAFARTAGRLVREQADAARTALSRVSTIGDRAEGHRARIAAKRLRYLLEPMRDAIPRVPEVVERLTAIQDELGGLHDAQLFGSEIAGMLAKEMASGKAQGDDSTPDADRAELLLAISGRLHRDEIKQFALVEEHWLGDHASDLWTDVGAIAATLDAIANEVRTVQRRYLLRTMVHDTPPAVESKVEEGYLPGDRIVERVRRVTDEKGVRHHHAVELDDGTADGAVLGDAIDPPVFDALWPLTKGRRWRANRLSIDADGRCWTIDAFADRDLVLASVAVSDEHEVVAVPAWLESVVDRDVTGDATYRPRELATTPPTPDTRVRARRRLSHHEPEPHTSTRRAHEPR